MSTWSFLTNHARVLLAIADDPDQRLRDIAETVGISERRVHGIVTELTASGYLTKQREGRRNRYAIHGQRSLSRDDRDHRTVGDLVELLASRDGAP